MYKLCTFVYLSRLVRLIAGLLTPGFNNQTRAGRSTVGTLLLQSNMLLLGLLFSVNAEAQTIFYVKPAASGIGNGSSWNDASGDLQAMINLATYGDSIFVARGTYKPNRKANAITVITPNDRDNTFLLVDDVGIYGGFTGTETATTKRNLSNPANASILSGDFSGNDQTMLVNGLPEQTGFDENAYHVVTAIGLSGGILDGLTITGGHANNTNPITVNALDVHRNNGGGFSSIKSKTTLNNCILENNRASNMGGGIYSDHSTIVINNSFIRQNLADEGGGLKLRSGSGYLTGTTVSSNRVVGEGGGGGVQVDEAVLYFIKSFAIGNYSNKLFKAGGLSATSKEDSKLHLIGSVIAGNRGNGVRSGDGETLIINCTLAGNTGSAIDRVDGEKGSLKIRNSILWENDKEVYGKYDMSYCVIDREYSGVGNLHAAPTFVNAPNRSTAPFINGDYRLLPFCNPAINSGDTTDISGQIPGSDIAGNPRYHIRIDRGAYEYTGVETQGPAGRRYYVKTGGTGNGSTWNNAFGDLQEAINVTACGDTIFVAKGTFRPNRKANALTVVTAGNRDNAFVLTAGVKIFGGFNGTENAVSQRILTTSGYTTLSGDFNDNDGISVTSQGAITYTGNAENAYHVVIAAGASDALLDGFTITGGRANGGDNITVNDQVVHRNIGAGVEIESASLTLRNCTVQNSHASNLGGGIYTYRSYLNIENSTIQQNKADDGGGLTLREGITSIIQSNIRINQAVESGGGIWASGDKMTLSSSHIQNNLAANGGGIYNRNEGSTSVISSVVSGNTATNNGGGLNNANDSRLLVINSLLSGNKAGNGGGGLYNANSATLYNCTISGNNATTGGGIYRSGGLQTIQNCIIWDNSDGISGAGTTSFSVVQGGATGMYIVNEDPGFLTSPAFSSAPFTNGNYRSQNCWVENAGDTTGISRMLPLTDLAGNPRFLDAIDMGAYERNAIPNIRRIYVKSGSSGSGSSWGNAFGDLQEAINAACSGDTLFVAIGSYRPTRKANAPDIITLNNRDNSFVLKNGLKIFGGFAGTETSITQRANGNLHATILTGDFNNNDNVSGSGSSLAITGNTENAYHVLIAAGIGNVLLDGISIRGGYASGNGTISVNGMDIYRDNAGGLYIQNSKSVILRNGYITGNQASNRGGGISGYASVVTIDKSTITQNRAGDGGGIGLRDGAKGKISHSIVTNNYAAADAGGLYISTPSTVVHLDTTQVTGNYAGSDGGGMRVSESTVMVNGGRIDENQTAGAGGGIFNVNSAYLYFTDASLSKNKANDNGGGIWNGASPRGNNAGQIFITRALISENAGGNRGGGVYNVYSQGRETCEIRNSRITKNTARNGAGIANYDLTGAFPLYISSRIYNSLIDQNEARNDGGGIYNDENAIAMTYNTTIAHNKAVNGGGIYNGNYTCQRGKVISATTTALRPFFATVLYGETRPIMVRVFTKVITIMPRPNTTVWYREAAPEVTEIWTAGHSIPFLAIQRMGILPCCHGVPA
ncbi:right-handed parallel beta-helix repeat-containing protein [Dyadobacter sp. LHD-138]|uniref:beta strand repeat-containing protein n=1 Tax=Dyadobacter sp. LHD-138 TaxID=3071413 RepID=UPI0027DED5FA|nr:right-handed parallel beta-helix repeat-containing protein [Dyadobacter sp. LHD-138]MDQ6476867.1 right-handed parallel beta-helix repeat-containing protein [Dyadobacter sp. LHD-138]